MSPAAKKPEKLGQHVPSTTEALTGVPPHGIKGAMPKVFISSETIILTATVILLVALLTAGSVSLWLRYRRRKTSPALVSDVQDADRLWIELKNAVNGMRTPSASELSTSTIVNQFTSDVSLLARRGVEIRTGSPIAERTTQEIEMMLKSGALRLPVVSEQEFRTILETLDSVRFAGQPITSQEAEFMLESLKTWIDALAADQMRADGQAHLTSLPVDDKGGIRVFDT